MHQLVRQAFCPELSIELKAETGLELNSCAALTRNTSFGGSNGIDSNKGAATTDSSLQLEEEANL